MQFPFESRRRAPCILICTRALFSQLRATTHSSVSEQIVEWKTHPASIHCAFSFTLCPSPSFTIRRCVIKPRYLFITVCRSQKQPLKEERSRQQQRWRRLAGANERNRMSNVWKYFGFEKTLQWLVYIVIFGVKNYEPLK